MMRRWLFALFLLHAPCAGAAPDEFTVNIGVLAYRGADHAIATWNPTIEYLNQALPAYRFRMTPLTLAQMSEYLGRREVDFVLTNPGNYIDLEIAHGVSRIATLESRISDHPHASVGSVIFVRADRDDINTLEDLRGKRFTAVRPEAFGGFEVAWRELAARHIDPHTDFAQLVFAGFPLDQIIFDVRDGLTDAGVVRACLLENLQREGKIRLQDFKVLNLRQSTSLNCMTSTRLYPDWPIATARTTPRALAKKVATALLAMPGDSPAAVAGRYRGWTVPVDYQPVHDLFRELEIGPYRRTGGLTLSELWQRYWHWAVMVLLALFWAAWHMWRVEHLVKVRTAQLSESNERLRDEIRERLRAEDEARQHRDELAHFSRVSMMGEMASSLAHELNQPLSAITSYLQGCEWRLEEGSLDLGEMRRIHADISAQSERAAAIIQRLRTFLRKNSVTCAELDLNQAVVSATELYASEARRKGMSVELKLAPDLPTVCSELIQVQQVVLNLMHNAAEAMADNPGDEPRKLVVTSELVGDMARVCFADNGCGFNDAQAGQLCDPFFTTKPGGMGMGLSICRTIIESQQGRLSVTRRRQRGATICFELPLHENRNDAAAVD